MKMERLNIARFREELATKDIDGGAKSLNEYQYNKMLIEILTKRNKQLEPTVMEFLETRPDKRDDGGYGVSQVIEKEASVRVDTELAKEYVKAHGDDVSVIQVPVAASKSIRSNLRIEVER